MLHLAAEESRQIRADASTVWKYRLDFNNLPSYNPDVSEVVLVSEGSGAGDRHGIGAKWKFQLATPRGPHAISLEVTSLVADREVAATMEGAMKAEEVFSVQPVDAGSCRAELSLWLDLPEGLSPDNTTAFLENGARQVVGELDAIVVHFAP